MTPCGKAPGFGASVFAAAIGFSVGFCAIATGAYAGEPATTTIEAGGDFTPGFDRASARPPATFFTINAVLAKLDRERGRGPGATRLAALAPADVATDAPPEPKETPAAGKDPFGLFTFRAPEGALWRKWRGIETDITRERAVLDRCREDAEGCPSNAAQFLRLIKAVKAKSGRDQLDEANRAVNIAIRYVSDYAQHGEADRWSAPIASFASGKGDCEDYAIAKYVALTEAGFSRDDLQLVLVRDRAVRQDHAVLAARMDGRWLLLDNRRSELMNDLDAISFTPLYAIDSRGVQLFAAPYARRGLLGRELEPAPAAANEAEIGEWSGQGVYNGSGAAVSPLPLLM